MSVNEIPMTTGKRKSDEEENSNTVLEKRKALFPSAEINEKRTDYLLWEDFFMGVAVLASQRSKDPNTQVGACIVNSNKVIVGIGYNGFPRGCSDDVFPWGKSLTPLHRKNLYVCHAEANAILNKNCEKLSGCILYVTLFPCNKCAILIIQSGISEIKYLKDSKCGTEKTKASKLMLQEANIRYSQYKPTKKNIEINF